MKPRNPLNNSKVQIGTLKTLEATSSELARSSKKQKLITPKYSLKTSSQRKQMRTPNMPEDEFPQR
jgi:hypothetical protein